MRADLKDSGQPFYSVERILMRHQFVPHEVSHLAQGLHILGEAHDFKKRQGSQLCPLVVGIAFAHQGGIRLLDPLGYFVGGMPALKKRLLKY